MNNLKIIIFSCSAYSDLWDNNILCLNKYWPSHPDYLICTESEPSYQVKTKEYKVIPNNNMSSRLIQILETVNSDYVFFTLDDYFLCKNVNVETMDMIFEYMKASDVDYCRIYNKPKSKTKPTELKCLKKLPLANTYEVNFYPAIWKRVSLLNVLKNNEDIWKSETRLTRRCREKGMNCVAANNKNIFEFVDIVRKGKYLRSAYRFLKREKLFISDRPVRTVKETCQLNIQTFVSDHSPSCVKKKIKNHYRKKGKVFYSDYADTDD